MSMNLAGSGKGPRAEMNVTPLIDVLLVLLIIFMIINPFVPLGEQALIPQPPNKKDWAPDQPIRTVVLQMSAQPGHQPTLRINDQDVSWQDLRARLKSVYENRVEKVLFVKADDSIDWENVAQAIDLAHGAGVDRVGLVTARIEQAQR